LKRVGIAASLLYYHYFYLWKTFFEELGLEVVVSSPTNKKIVENGVKKAVDDICLPVKLTFGHVMDLAGRVDYLFIPRLVSLEPDAFTCPKIIGLPDMIKANLDNLPPASRKGGTSTSPSGSWDGTLPTNPLSSNRPSRKPK